NSLHPEGIHHLERLLELLGRILDPVVHRVTDDEPRLCNLLQYFSLKRGVDIAETYITGFAISLRDNGIKLFENIELRIQSVPHIEVIMVAPDPSERLAVLDNLQPVHIDVAFLQELQMFFRKIAPDNR